jgi:hypothetical protein
MSKRKPKQKKAAKKRKHLREVRSAVEAEGIDPNAEVKVVLSDDGKGGYVAKGVDAESQQMLDVIHKEKGYAADEPLRIDKNVKLLDESGGEVTLKKVGAVLEPADGVGILGDLVDKQRELRYNVNAGFVDEQVDQGDKGAEDTYLQVVKSLLEGSSGVARNLVRGEATAPLDSAVNLSRLLWARMKNARVFELPAEVYTALHKSLDHEIYDRVIESGRASTPAEVDKYATDTIGFPGELPFDHIYLGYGAGVAIPLEHAEMRFAKGALPANLLHFRLLGYLLADVGGGQIVVEMVHVITTDDDYLMPIPMYGFGHGWESASTLTPWVLSSSLKLFNDHKVVIEEKRPGLGQRRQIDKIRKKYRTKQTFIPKPYYVLRLKHETIEDDGKRADGASPVRELSYRYDRRGHERCYIRRGPLPLKEDDREKLEKAGYRIWVYGRPDAVAQEQLSIRHKPPKRADEWLAILTVHIDPRIIGDPSLPYIPAKRMPAAS